MAHKDAGVIGRPKKLCLRIFLVGPKTLSKVEGCFCAPGAGSDFSWVIGAEIKRWHRFSGRLSVAFLKTGLL